MKVLITGSLGYVGSVLSQYLISNGIETLGLDLSIFHERSASKSFVLKKFSQINNDDLRGVDVVIHLAGISNDPIGNKFETLTHEINFNDSCILFDRVMRMGSIKKFIFASSCSNYGVVKQNLKVDEEAILQPQTAYSKSKVDFENYLKSKSNLSDMQIICFRFATACGPSPSMRTDLVLNSFVDSALRNNQILLTSNGMAYRPLIDVLDMARFMMWGIQVDNMEKYSVFNAGYDVNNFKIIDLAKKVQFKFPGSVIIFSEDAVSDNRSYTVDFDKIKKATGFDKPLRTIDQSVDSLVNLFNTSSMSWIGSDMPKLKKSALKRLDCISENIEILHSHDF